MMRKTQRHQTPHYMAPLVGSYMDYRAALGRTRRQDHEALLNKFAKAWDKETRHTAPNRLIDNIDQEWVQDYYLAAYGTKAATTKRAYQQVIKQFLVWLVRYGVDKDCAEFKPGRTAGRSDRRFLWMTADEMRRAWEMEPQIYWRILFMWMALTCCRVNEVQGATWGDIHDMTFWDINRKKTHDPSEWIKLPRRLRDELVRYKFWYQSKIGRQVEDTDFVFPAIQIMDPAGSELKIVDPKRHRGEKTFRRIKMMIARALPDLDPELLDHAGCHTLRRSGAQAMLNRLVAQGIANALKLVSVRLGHDSVTTTEGYLNTDEFKQMLHGIMEDFDLFDDGEAEVIPLRSAQAQ